MAETVSDILGKGFKYEQREKIERIQEVITGTIGAFVGGANWGPINLPTLVLKDFAAAFGIPLTKNDGADFSGLAATYTLGYSPFCWYTRVVDGTESAAQFNIFKAATSAEIVGTKMLNGAALVIRSADDAVIIGTGVQNNKLAFNVFAPDSGAGQDGVLPDTIEMTLATTPGCDAVPSTVTLPTGYNDASSAVRTAWNFAVGDTINFSIDGISYRYVVRSEIVFGTRNANEPDFTNLLLPTTGSMDASYAQVPVPASFTGAIGAVRLADTPGTAASYSGSPAVHAFYTGTPTGCSTAVTIVAPATGPSGAVEITFTGNSFTTMLGHGGILEGYGFIGVQAQTPSNGSINLTGGTAAATTITANVVGIASNHTLTGNGTSNITALLAAQAPGHNYTLGSAGGTQIPGTGVSIAILGGIDIITTNVNATAISIICDDHGTIGNTTITGDGTKTIATLVGEVAGTTYTIATGGDQRLRSGSTITIAGGQALGVGTWEEFVPSTGVDTYAERFVYALRKYVISPTLYISDPLVVGNLSDCNTKAVLLAYVDAGVVTLDSTKQGVASSIKIYSIPKVFTATTIAPITSLGSNTDISVIVLAINAEFTSYINATTSVVAMIDPETYYLQIVVADSGEDYGIQVIDIADNLYSALGLTANDEVTGIVYGTDAIANAGTLLAKYTGSDGNTIVFDKSKTQDGYILTIYFRGYNIATFFNYSYIVSTSNFIGKLMASNSQVANIVSLEVADGMTELPAFAFGQMTLSGGTSGIAAITEMRYNFGLDEYKNIDLYSVDVVCVSGHSSELVHDKVEEVCNYRKDCFGVVDPPESVAGVAENGSSIYSMIDWHNGVGGLGRNNKLNSQFICTYFPWISIEDGTDTAESNWYAPSVRTVGAIACSDKVAGHKFAAPAGNNRTPLTGIYSLAQYLREDDKNRLYADELGNSVNPIVYTTTRGFFIDGQKNTDRNFMAISRLNVLRTSLYIKKRMYEIAPNYFWSPLTKTTQDSMAAELKTICVYLSSSAVSAIKDDYTIVCDATLNTNLVEAQRGLIAYIEWTPVRSIEKIKVISVIRDLTVSVSFA